MDAGGRIRAGRPEHCSVALAEYEADVCPSILIILQTSPDERVMRPDVAAAVTI